MIEKKYVRLYFYDNMDDNFKPTKPILGYLTQIMLYWGIGY